MDVICCYKLNYKISAIVIKVEILSWLLLVAISSHNRLFWGKIWRIVSCLCLFQMEIECSNLSLVRISLQWLRGLRQLKILCSLFTHLDDVIFQDFFYLALLACQVVVIVSGSSLCCFLLVVTDVSCFLPCCTGCQFKKKIRGPNVSWELLTPLC